MKTFALSATKRTAEQVGKKASKLMRRENILPAVLYGGKETLHLCVKEEDLRGLIYTPNIYLVELDVEGTKYSAVLKEAQFHPVSDHILHIDLLEVREEKPIVMKVPVKLEGYAAGVKAGGKLTQERRSLKVRAPYTLIPERLVVDVTPLRLGKTIQVKELSYENLELVDAPETVVCAVKLTRAARGKAAGAAAAEQEAE